MFVYIIKGLLANWLILALLFLFIVILFDPKAYERVSTNIKLRNSAVLFIFLYIISLIHEIVQNYSI